VVEALPKRARMATPSGTPLLRLIELGRTGMAASPWALNKGYDAEDFVNE